jgi:hypothetical protein
MRIAKKRVHSLEPFGNFASPMEGSGDMLAMLSGLH